MGDLFHPTDVRSYELKDGKVVFTLQGVSEDKSCLEFRIIQENEVAELKPSIVKVHDFYRPEERNIKVSVKLALYVFDVCWC